MTAYDFWFGPELLIAQSALTSAVRGNGKCARRRQIDANDLGGSEHILLIESSNERGRVRDPAKKHLHD
jgi:hypothetical protein